MTRPPQTRAQARGLGRALAQIRGHVCHGEAAKATLHVGRKAGLSLAGFRERQVIPVDTVVKTLLHLRVDQVGHEALWATTVHARGDTKGSAAPSLTIELFHGGAERTAAAFIRNIERLAGDLAHALAQREILIEWSIPGRRRGQVEARHPAAIERPAATTDAATARAISASCGGGASGAERRRRGGCPP